MALLDVTFLLCSLLVCAVNTASISNIASISNTASISSVSSKTPPRPRGFGSARHAVIIGIDGFGGVYFKNASQNYPALRSFLDLGAYTTRARGVYPTSSGPNWGVYLTGMGPMEHGIFSNDWGVSNSNPPDETTYSIPPISGRNRPLTIFSQVKKKDPNLKTGMMFTWPWFKNFAMINPDVDQWYIKPDNVSCGANQSGPSCTNMADWMTLNSAMKFIRDTKPTLMFIQLDSLDSAGHNTCWGCPQYYEMLSEKDKQIQLLLDSLNHTVGMSGKPMLDDTLVVIVSDHGGWRDSHSFPHPFIALVDIPILIRGPKVLAKHSMESHYVSSLDVPVTVLNALGVETSEFMRGRVLEEVYD